MFIKHHRLFTASEKISFYRGKGGYNLFLRRKMRQDAFRRRVLRRVASARGIPLDDLVKSDDRDIIEKFWRLLKLRDLEIFSEDALNDCQATITRMEQRIKRNSRYNLMKKLENDGYFDIAKGKYLRIEPFFYFL